MSILSFENSESTGSVFSVDTATVMIKVDEIDKLRKLRVNQLLAIRSAKAGQHLIGIIGKITRKMTTNEDVNENPISFENLISTENMLKVSLIGTLLDKIGINRNVFKRTLQSVPEIDAECFLLDGENITSFMNTISSPTKYDIPLRIGTYAIDERAIAFLDGDKFFQRHAAIVGSTGSGKSWCVAKIVEQVAHLPMANCILFDIHGEYSDESFSMTGIQHLRMASPMDLQEESKLENGILMLPYWLLTYEEMIALLLDRSDSNAPNQAALFSKLVLEEKIISFEEAGNQDQANGITIDSPVPYSLTNVIKKLRILDSEMVTGANSKEKQGPHHGKLSRFIQRLEVKRQDKRLGFLFQISEKESKLDWMNKFCETLILGTANSLQKAGVKVIDFSEIPSDILSLVISLIAKTVFSVQQWTAQDKRHPIALLCDEAHLYIPERSSQDTTSELGLKGFKRIAKEGRKYGLSLTIISQRPAEVNRTVLSQCNNFLALRLSNSEDQQVIKRLLPDNLSGLTDVLPILDIGEALIVGDASLLPVRVLIDEPKIKPQSATVKFWLEWSKGIAEQDIPSAVRDLRRQSKSRSLP